MEGLASQSGSGKVGFIIQGDIRSKHDAIMRISEVVLDEIQRDQLAIADTLEKAARTSARHEDHLLRSRAPNSLGNPSNDSTSGLGSEIVADGHFTDEVSQIPTCVVQGLKPACKYHVAIFDGNVYPSRDASTHTTSSKPNIRPASTGNIMTSKRETSNKQDPNKTKAKTAEWDEPLLKNASFVLDLLPTTVKKSSHEQPTFSHEMPMCDFTKGFSAFSGCLSNETQSSGLGESPIISGEIPDDTMMSDMVQGNREETAFSKQDPLSLLDLVPDVPKDIMNICWKYQDLDDGQLENMRHYMIAKAFGWRGKVPEENVL